MKKAIVIIGSILLTLFSILGIIIKTLSLFGVLDVSGSKVRVDAYSYGEIIILLLVILVAAAAILAFMPGKLSKIWVMTTSVICPIITLFVGCQLLPEIKKEFLPFDSYSYFLLSVLGIGAVLVIIVSFANIHQALKPAPLPVGKEQK